MINIISSSRYKIDRKYLRELTKECLENQAISSDKVVNVVFIGKNKMREISKKYKNENIALPVLSFRYNDHNENELFGEIIICYPQAVLLAAERDKKVQDIIKYLINHAVTNLSSN